MFEAVFFCFFFNQSEIEHGHGSSLSNKETSSFSPNDHEKKTDMAVNDFGLSEQTRNLHTWTSRHPSSETWDTSSVRQLWIIKAFFC